MDNVVINGVEYAPVNANKGNRAVVVLAVLAFAAVAAASVIVSAVWNRRAIDEPLDWTAAAYEPRHDGMPLQSRWRAVHLIRWEEVNGPLPKGMALKCLDGDKTNTEPANWALVPRALLPRLNGRSGRNYDTAPAELKPAIMAIAKLEHAARERRRKER